MSWSAVDGVAAEEEVGDGEFIGAAISAVTKARQARSVDFMVVGIEWYC